MLFNTHNISSLSIYQFSLAIFDFLLSHLYDELASHTHSLVLTLLFITPFLLNNNEDMALLLSSASFLHPLALFIASSSKFTEHSSPLSNEEGESMRLLGLVSLCVCGHVSVYSCMLLYMLLY